MKTWNDAIDEAVTLLSTHSFAVQGECSASVLTKCKGPTLFAKLYIDKLETIRSESTDYVAGMEAAIDILESYRVERKPEPHLVEADWPEQFMSLYVSRLQAAFLPE